MLVSVESADDATADGDIWASASLIKPTIWVSVNFEFDDVP